jgi:hypothetical protein
LIYSNCNETGPSIHYRIYIDVFWEKMQITENQILSKCRERNVFWCRIILCNFFKKQRRNNSEISKLLKTTKGAVTYFVKKYSEDFKYCESFRKMTIEIENLKKQKTRQWRQKKMKSRRLSLLKYKHLKNR